MRIVLLQLSDIHVRSGRDSVLSRAVKVKEACHGAAPSASACIIVLSGDIAFSGQDAEYDAAYSFFDELRTDLLSLPAMEVVEFVAVPGNHDCDFTHESDVRRYLLENIDALYESDIRPASDRTRAILEVQNNFFRFEAKLTKGKEIDVDERLNFGHLVKIGNFSIKFQCYNTAWLSRKEEIRSKLFLPDEAIEPISAEANLCVSVFHHPYNWLDANNYRVLRDSIEGTSDLVFTGHEHMAGGGTIERFSGEHLHYLEAPALQGDAGDLDSGFNLLVIDVETGEQRVDQFHWNGDYYATKESNAWAAVIRIPHGRDICSDPMRKLSAF